MRSMPRHAWSRVALAATVLFVGRLAVAQDRWEADIAKFEAADRQNPPPANGVVFIGSSSIVRWKLAEAFPELGASAINRGFGGSGIADAVQYVDRVVVPYKPRIVVLYSGDNDLVTPSTPEQIADQYQQFIRKVRAALPQSKIVVISIKPSLQRWAQIDKARAANALIQRACESSTRVAYVDVERPMLGADGKPRPELYVEDGLHMTAEGYKIWNAAVRPLVISSR